MKRTVATIIEKKNKILLVKRNHKPFKNHWALPGGHIDRGETPEKAVIREVKEETNLRIRPELFMECVEIFKKIKWYAHVYVFAGKAEGIIKIKDKEIKDIKLFSINKLPKLAFNHEEIIKRYRKNNKDTKKRN